MIIYNVTVKVHPDYAESWLKWMKEEHLEDMMGTGMFVRHRVAQLLEQEEDDGFTYVIQYECADRQNYERYLNEFSATMRQKGLDKFGDKFIAFRTLMKIIV